MVRCGYLPAGSLTDCETVLGKAPLWGTADEAMKGGRVAFDAPGAKRCVDTLTQATCDLAATYCISGFPGAESAAELASSGLQGPACMGAFRPLVTAGGNCLSDDECVDGVCSGPYTGAPGVCLTPLPDGAQCVAFSGKTCAGMCLFGGDASSDEGVCVPRGTEGAQCDLTLDCVADLVCISGGAAPFACHRPGPLGSTCSGNALHAEVECLPGLHCGAAHTCVPPEPAGASCYSPDACLDGLYCVGLSMVQVPRPGTCAPPLSIGTACKLAADPQALGEDGCVALASFCSGSTSECAACDLLSDPTCVSRVTPDAGPMGLNGCKAYTDHTAEANVNLTWGFNVASSPDRCMKIRASSSITWVGDFTTHPLDAFGGDTPNPISSAQPPVVADAGEGGTTGGATITVTFPSPGYYGFHCQVHSTMSGTVYVVP
jgi:plastocyanin